MQVSAHKSHKRSYHPKRIIRLNSNKGHTPYLSLKPLKKANKEMVRYIVAKPYQTIGFATLLTGIFAGVAFLTIKNIIK